VKLSTLILGVVLSVLVAVLLVPAGLGALRPDDRDGPRGPGAAAITSQPVHPNDRAGPLGPGGVALEQQASTWAGERDYGLFTPTGEVVTPAVEPTATVTPTGGFDWTPVVYGAAAFAAIVLLLGAGAAVMTTRHHGGPGRPVPH